MSEIVSNKDKFQLIFKMIDWFREFGKSIDGNSLVFSFYHIESLLWLYNMLTYEVIYFGFSMQKILTPKDAWLLYSKASLRLIS